jgi:3-hydroxyisobutyrate dehydrogenase
MSNIAFIGLGVMGGPMAGHLKRAGHEITVFNRSHERARAWIETHGGAEAMSPAEAVEGKDLVFACVGRDSDVREIALGRGGAFPAMKKGAVFIDHTTASATLVRELAGEAERRGFGFVDAPVSGGQQGALNGALTIMCGGTDKYFRKAQPVMAAYAKKIALMGGPGAGQLTKMVNQICIAGLVEGLAEGLSFARASGLDPQAVVDVISKGAAQSWQMDNRHATMLAGEYDFGFAVEWMRKDLGICFAEAANNGADLPVARLVDGFYAEVENMGGRRWDTSSLFARLEAKRK